MKTKENTKIGHALVGNKAIEIGRADRRQHVYVVGQTGVGKSTLLRNLLSDDIASGCGCGLIDPHGELAEELLELIPAHRINDVVYFNAIDEDHPIGLNLFQLEDHDPQLIATGLVTSLKSIWRDSWGPRLEYILYNAVRALLECQNTSLLGVRRMLVERGYRHWVVKQVQDPEIRSFWIEQFERWDNRQRQEAIAPILNKVGQLAARPVIRNIIGQTRNRLDIGQAMDRGKIVICNLSRGQLGDESSNLLGALLVTQFQLAAMRRAKVAAEERRPFYLVVDEFANFGTSQFESALSEARKYGLALVLAHQFTKQLDSQTREAIFGNVGSIVAFRCGFDDAEVLTNAFGKDYPPQTLVELSNYRICARLLKDGAFLPPVMGKTTPGEQTLIGKKQTILTRSRERYAMERKVVEDKINRWMKNPY